MDSAFEPYINNTPLAILILLTSFLLTPLIGAFAKKFGFIDLPKEQRKRTDKTLSTRIHKKAKPRLGGLAVLIPFLIISLSLSTKDPRLLGLSIGLIVLLITGILDDKYELSAKVQMTSQLIAALIIIISGVTIKEISILNHTIDFTSFSQDINFGSFIYTFRFPADIITVIWILGIINAINWMYGIDTIGEITVALASLTTMLLSVRSGNFEVAILSGVLAFGLFGFIPFNLYPSKIMSGTAGTTGYGFIIAVLTILGGSKITASIILLSIPILDMIWVIIYRLIKLKNVSFLKRPFVSGNVHFHHRLMELGLSQIQVLLIEISIMAIICVLSYTLAGFSDNFICLISIFAVLIVIFTIINILIKRGNKLAKKKQEEEKPPIIRDGPTPEERYAY